ncbi:hypothetical protein UWK_00670 [Desulfocapsa sulfexigens DSM 10523]|uniref:Uncharacterized protein n=1 Tax=Desulfocapsa sulfexigens (strain DSM 10523 / SB164P1) TaxID=1167006 RepID=M1PBV9_DESSD|nr:hypothetical protein [Desulfocapsa sulfexigens]AGF77250.1 hypothetical protein UWK_00670 [Desulfocapsa sulfexigens DSM 10523]
MCLEFNEENREEEDDEMYEVGAYKSYTTVRNSMKPWGTKNAIVYNDVMEELNYSDNDGRLYTLKLFTHHPLDDRIVLGSSDPL